MTTPAEPSGWIVRDDGYPSFGGYHFAILPDDLRGALVALIAERDHWHGVYQIAAAERDALATEQRGDKAELDALQALVSDLAALAAYDGLRSITNDVLDRLFAAAKEGP